MDFLLGAPPPAPRGLTRYGPKYEKQEAAPEVRPPYFGLLAGARVAPQRCPVLRKGNAPYPIKRIFKKENIMLIHPIMEKLQMMKFYGMRKAFEDQLQMADIGKLSFEERLGLLVDRETTERADRRLQARLRKAKLRHNASMEDIDFHHPRKLDKQLMLSLSSCEWVKAHHNVFIIGSTGIGKSYLACALAQKACREGYSALYMRLPKLFSELSLAKGDGRYGKLLSEFARTDVLVLDDWGLAKMNKEHQRDFLEIVEDRYEVGSTVITSQLPVAHWHEVIDDPTLADAILDRVVHNAYKMELEGDSMRKKKRKLT